jgi:hypothetical protein
MRGADPVVLENVEFIDDAHPHQSAQPEPGDTLSADPNAGCCMWHMFADSRNTLLRGHPRMLGICATYEISSGKDFPCAHNAHPIALKP